jgi:hypothetical protein
MPRLCRYLYLLWSWPLESPDGQTLYFAENSGTSFTLHTSSLNPTGTESRMDGLPPLSFVANWDIVQGGVYFFQRDDILALNYFDFSTRKVRPIFKISGGGGVPGLSVSAAGAATSCSLITSTSRVNDQPQ